MLEILVIGENQERFRGQVNALQGKCSFYFINDAGSLSSNLKERDISIVIFHYKNINKRIVDTIRRLRRVFQSETFIVVCAKISKKDMCTLFRSGIRDVLEQSFRKEIRLNEVIERINVILSRREKSSNHHKFPAEAYLRYLSQAGRTYPVDERIRNAKEYIEKNYNSPLNLADVSNVACMSKYHFCRIFKKVEKVSFSHYVNRVRIEKAKKLLLETGASITEVAFEVGFLSLSNFTSLFKNFEKVPPGKYRKKVGNRSIHPL